MDRFPDGETAVKSLDDVRGRDVFVVQPTCPPVNDNLMELLVSIDCLRRASASRITAVIPYFGYARQDRKDEGRVPITAKLVANLLVTAGANRILAMDLHAPQIQGFFDIPVDHLTAEPVLTRYYRTLAVPDLVLVSPDVGNVKQADLYSDMLRGGLAIIDKRRLSGAEAVVQHIIGEVKGKNVLMVDDMISTAGTVCEAARLIKDHGANSIRVTATHAVFSAPAYERLASAPIDEIVVTDTIPLDDSSVARLPKLKVLTVAELLGEAIRRIHRNESVSSLFVH